MIHREPGFLAVASLIIDPLPLVRKLDRRHVYRKTEKESNLLEGKGEGVWKEVGEEPNPLTARNSGPL
jgi:hypothetical protein